MKKILFSCLLALGIGANAQYNFSEDFEGDRIGMKSFGGGSFNTVNYCSATTSGGLTYSASTTQTGWMADLSEVADYYGQSNNGQKIDVNFKYKKAAGLTGTLYVMYALFNESSNNWTIFPVGTGVVLSADAVTTTCGTVSATIPAGTLDPSKTYGIGTWLQSTGGTTGALYIDDIVVQQATVANPPACTAFTYPTNGSSVSSGTAVFKWTTAENASSYKVTVGTSSGSSNVLNTTVLGSLTSLNVSLNANTTYYAKIVPTNNVGDAVGCQEITFSTNTSVGHCGPLTSSAPTLIAPIRSVTFSGITNTSDPTPSGIGTFPVHQDFTTTEFPWFRDQTTKPLSIIGSNNANPANGWAMSVFIDWNNDGDFDDAGEAYFNTTATIKRVVNVANLVPINANITIPSGVAYGKKFMRIKYNFSGTTIHDALTTGCTNMINGQVEDYTINYIDALAVSDVNKKSVSVYPNPFKDVLNISDVKGVKSISVNDVSGREVKTLAPAAELNLSSLKAGLYIVNLKMEDGSTKAIKAIKK